MLQVKAEFPPKFQGLFVPKRYKVYYGGRGGAKSWAIARALLIRGVQEPLRVLCVRELQNSIAESVHKLLSDQIAALGLGAYYDVQKAVILGPNGTSFSFEGIKNNVQKIKSYEGVDVCWVEEAALVTKNSWDVLVPTIRKPGSEIWVSFNPELEEDPTYQMFVVRRPTNAIVQKVTWRDNPWFPAELKQEMEDCKNASYDDYLWIWEGHCKRVLDGSVYKREIRQVLEEGRLTSVPWQKGIPVDVTLDLGRSDYTATWFRQSVGLERRYIDFYKEHGRDLDWHIEAIAARGYRIGTITLPHDAAHSRLGMRVSIEKQFRDAFPNNTVKVLKKGGLMEGIQAVRRIFGNCWFDEEKTGAGFKDLSKYGYKVIPGTTRFSDKPDHDTDGYSDTADAFRYDALTKPGMAMDEEMAKANAARSEGLAGLFGRVAGAGRSIVGGQGWQGR